MHLASGLIAALLSACALLPATPIDLRLSGSLYGPRDRALPADAQFVVELRQGDKLLAEQRGALRNLPQPFELVLPAGTAVTSPQSVVLQAAMYSRGGPSG